MIWVSLLLALFALAILFLMMTKLKAGPQTLDQAKLDRGRVLLAATPDKPGTGWEGIGSKTTADGLDLRFDHDDDPQAEATILAPIRERALKGSSLANQLTITLASEWQTHHVHTAGYVFRVTLKGDDTVAGREVRLQMVVGQGGRPWGGRIENDDDTNAAVGGWIRIRSAEILHVGPVR